MNVSTVSQPDNRSEAEVASEARLLRQHRDRLELRLRILEEHNGQLENQLTRLRLLLADHNNRSSFPQQHPHQQQHHQSAISTTFSSTMEMSSPPFSVSTSRSVPCPPAYRRTGAAANMSELLQMADSIGQAVGTLVTVFTDSESDATSNNV